MLVIACDKRPLLAEGRLLARRYKRPLSGKLTHNLIKWAAGTDQQQTFRLSCIFDLLVQIRDLNSY